MTEQDFESLTWPTEADAFEAGRDFYGMIELETSQNIDGSWYVYPKDEE